MNTVSQIEILKTKNIVAVQNKVNKTEENSLLNSPMKINESEFSQIHDMSVDNLHIEENVFEARKSVVNLSVMEKDDHDNVSEMSRKGKNISDKYKNSLPPSVFKKREFVLDHSNTISNIKGNLFIFKYPYKRK